MNVGPWIRPTTKLLGCHVTQGSHQLAFMGQVSSVLTRGQPEVSNPQGPLSVQQQVGRLNVAVNDALLVRICQCLRSLQSQLPDVSPILRRVVCRVQDV